MKDGFIKVAAATPKIRVADTDYNAEAVISLAREAAAKGVKVCVFPELCLTGATCGDLYLRDTLLDGAERAIAHVAGETAALDMLIVVGLPVRCGGAVKSGAAVLFGGKVIKTAQKGETALVFCENVPGLTAEIVIGESADGAAPLVLNPCALPELAGAAERRRERSKALSAQNACAIVSANAGDGESTTNAVYGAHNLIAENGRILAENRWETGLCITEIDLGALLFERRQRPAAEKKAADTPGFTFAVAEAPTTLTRRYPRLPFVPEGAAERAARCREVFTIQVMGLVGRMEHIGAKSAVVGVSGGLDSTLTVLVCAEALRRMGLPAGALKAVTMPCFGTTVRTKSNAEKLSELLGADFREISLSDSVKQHFSDIGHDMDNHNVVFENAQARERTQVVMDIANGLNGLAVGTGDLSELALGWATYNGDHMSMYGVNAGVPKTLVRHVVRWYADTCGNETLSAVLYDILDTPVSPELLPAKGGEIAQKTEDLVGPYELHDFFLYHFFRRGAEPKKLLRLAAYAFAGEYDRETIRKWLSIFLRRFFTQQFKRSCLPDGPKIGSVSLSPRGDWAMPSDAAVTLWLNELEEPNKSV